jgi:hypothetical protein
MNRPESLYQMALGNLALTRAPIADGIDKR